MSSSTTFELGIVNKDLCQEITREMIAFAANSTLLHISNLGARYNYF
jgi:hypothetical protein